MKKTCGAKECVCVCVSVCVRARARMHMRTQTELDSQDRRDVIWQTAERIPRANMRLSDKE